ncbi:MAG: (2Fe-2S)-binding protein [Candidatus Electryonea clarkiae]|nr:(2Fe-2S)-binding protein [Candidatus Electryonea clarkiae]MDP8286429.1 (2Fe-2S)-binding protein [Candidatus Electryonea clarkiae]
MKKLMTLTVNGIKHEVAVEPRRTLLELIREDLGLTGTKKGCGIGDCGACTVLVDEVPTFSCLMLALQADGCKVETIEGLTENGELSKLQEAFVKHGAIQCGYCTPGMIMTSTELLRHNPNPTEHEIRHAISGNLCRCTGYQKIVEAVTACGSETETGEEKS